MMENIQEAEKINIYVLYKWSVEGGAVIFVKIDNCVAVHQFSFQTNII